MRRRNVVALTQADVDADAAKSPEQWAREAMIEEFGPRSASWLLWNQKDKLHRRGQFDVTFEPGQEEPPWFQLAVAAVRQRPQWAVEIIRVREHRRYRFKWHGWLRNARAATRRT